MSRDAAARRAELRVKLGLDVDLSNGMPCTTSECHQPLAGNSGLPGRMRDSIDGPVEPEPLTCTAG